MVDDAIVMLENIVRHMEMGETRMEAALLASREIGFTILSMTISLVAVFIPVLFMGGIVGRLLHEFSVTIAVAILISGFVSLTLTPMLGSRFLRIDHAGASRRRSTTRSKRGFNGMTRAYEYTLQAVLRHQFATLLVGIRAARSAPSGCSSPCPRASFPARTAASSSASTHGRPGHFVRLDGASTRQRRRRHRRSTIRTSTRRGRVPRVGRQLRVPASSPCHEAAHRARAFRGSDDRGAAAESLSSVPGILAFLQNPPPITIGGQFTTSVYQLTLQSANLNEIYDWVPTLMREDAHAARLPGREQRPADRQPAGEGGYRSRPRQALGVRRNRSRMRCTRAYGDRQVSTIYTPANSIR